MRVAFLTPCPYSQFGGVQLSARLAWLQIAQSAEARMLSYDVHPCVHSGCYQDPTFCSNSKFAVVRHATRLRWWADTIVVWHIGLLKLLPLIAKRASRVILFLHGVECWHRLDWLTCQFLGRVDLFLSNSTYTWNRFAALHPDLQSRGHIRVPLGLGVPEDCPNVTPSRVAALIVARMARGEDYKGHRELIRAWPRLIQRHPEATLLIAGTGDLQPDLELLAAECGVATQVRFLGRISDEEKQNLLDQCRCLVMPSRGEGFGLVYLEAMRKGRPCLISNCDASVEVVNPPEAGIAVEPGDLDAVVEALYTLIGSGPEWQRMSAGARSRYESQFTAAHFQERLMKALIA